MAHYDLEEQEQIATLKAWWSTYGHFISGFILLVALSVLIWNSFSWYQYKQANEAAMVYQQFEAALRAKDSAQVTSIAGELIEKYAAHTYATLAALEAGAFSLENQDQKTAEQQLKWAVEKGHLDFKDLSRLRFANFLANEKKFEEALAVLKKPQNARFLPAFLDLQGDIFWAQGKHSDAVKCWENAQNHIVADSSFHLAYVVLKDALTQKISTAASIAEPNNLNNEKKSTLSVEKNNAKAEKE